MKLRTLLLTLALTTLALPGSSALGSIFGLSGGPPHPCGGSGHPVVLPIQRGWDPTPDLCGDMCDAVGVYVVAAGAASTYASRASANAYSGNAHSAAQEASASAPPLVSAGANVATCDVSYTEKGPAVCADTRIADVSFPFLGQSILAIHESSCLPGGVSSSVLVSTAAGTISLAPGCAGLGAGTLCVSESWTYYDPVHRCFAQDGDALRYADGLGNLVVVGWVHVCL